MRRCTVRFFFFFFFNDPATTEIYTLSLHDALPISLDDLLPEAFAAVREAAKRTLGQRAFDVQLMGAGDRKSTRLNSSHTVISYAVFCLKKKKKQSNTPTTATHLAIAYANQARDTTY